MLLLAIILDISKSFVPLVIAGAKYPGYYWMYLFCQISYQSVIKKELTFWNKGRSYLPSFGDTSIFCYFNLEQCSWEIKNSYTLPHVWVCIYGMSFSPILYQAFVSCWNNRQPPNCPLKSGFSLPAELKTIHTWLLPHSISPFSFSFIPTTQPQTQRIPSLNNQGNKEQPPTCSPEPFLQIQWHSANKKHCL